MRRFHHHSFDRDDATSCRLHSRAAIRVRSDESGVFLLCLHFGHYRFPDIVCCAAVALAGRFAPIYVVAYIEGFNSFMAGGGNRPDPYATWLTEEALEAERDGYLAGVAAAYDAWLHYSQTNAVRQK